MAGPFRHPSLQTAFRSGWRTKPGEEYFQSLFKDLVKGKKDISDLPSADSTYTDITK